MRTFVTILFRAALAFFAVLLTFDFFVDLIAGEKPLYEVIETGLLAAGLIMLFVSEFRHIPFRYIGTAYAAILTYAAVTPEYTLWTAIIGALAGVYIVAAFLAWTYHRELSALADEWTDGEDDGGDDEIWLRADVAEEFRKAQASEPTLTVAEFLKREKL